MGLGRIPLGLIICVLLGLVVPESCNAQSSPRDFLAAHNRARAQKGVGPLTWDNTVAAYARNYANQHIGDCELIHSSGPYGENLAMSTGDMSGVDAVAMWLSEESEYDYNSNSCTGENPWGCLHYTQVMWRNSVRLGCAKVRCDSGGTFITCNYDPPGNFEGEWPFDVLKASV